MPPNISIYNILLEKLSQRINWFYFEKNDKNYLVNADECLVKAYLWHKITNESPNYKVKAKYIPHKDYVRKICKITKFSDSGLYLKHISEDKFEVEPLNITFDSIQTARQVYEVEH